MSRVALPIVLLLMVLAGCTSAWSRGEECRPVEDGAVGFDPRLPSPALQTGESYSMSGWIRLDGDRHPLNTTYRFDGIESIIIRSQTIPAYRSTYWEEGAAARRITMWSDQCGDLRQVWTIPAAGEGPEEVLRFDFSDCSNWAWPYPELQVGDAWDDICKPSVRSLTAGDAWEQDWSSHNVVTAREIVRTAAGSFEALRVESTYTDSRLFLAETHWFSADACSLWIRSVTTNSTMDLSELNCAQARPS